MKMSFDLNLDTDSAIEIYDEDKQTVERWFVSVDDILYFRSMVKKEFGDPAYTMENYF